MNDDRKKKLEELRAKKNTSQIVVTSAEPFVEALEKKINQLKEVLGVGVGLNNVDGLIESLGEVSALKNDVAELKKSIDALKFPDLPKDIKINGLDDLVKAAQLIGKKKDVAKVDISTITPITDQVGNLISAIEAIQVPKQGQKPEDYVPMRRVMLVGKRLMYDDSHYVGGGGGSTVPNPLPITGTIGTSPAGAGSVSLGGTRLRTDIGDQNTTITSSTAATTIVSAIAATYCDLVDLVLTNISSTGTEVQLFNDDGTTIRSVFYVPANDTRGIVFSVPFTQAAVNKTWQLKTVTSIASLKITAHFVKNS